VNANHKALTPDELIEWAELKDEEAGVYLSLIVPLLHRLGDETVITMEEAMGIPEGAQIGMQRVGESDVRVWVQLPEEGS
jgi:hypothetical protein